MLHSRFNLKIILGLFVLSFPTLLWAGDVPGGHVGPKVGNVGGGYVGREVGGHVGPKKVLVGGHVGPKVQPLALVAEQATK